MTTKKKVHREPFLFQLIFNLFGPDESNEAEVQQMTNGEFYVYLIFVTMGMFLLSYLIKFFTN
jgi:hypothetical protein